MKQTRILVGIGLLFNIIAALITNFYIDEAGAEANVLSQRQQQNDNLIRQVWLQLDSLERKRELILGLVSQDTPPPASVGQLIEQDLRYWTPDMPAAEIKLSNLPALNQHIQGIQLELRERIDNYYLENLDLNEQINEQMLHTSRIRNLALFLQIIGLALILARDLSRS
ncbi:hypothetical protein [Aliagarivorans marinus]|uniref:hypothetical protein n=1 Tax=Aliagarivorans marinus TaxID=561965 RepID=UPI00040C4341|nr:hypothetical protein [Aliagarivorans marinus]